MKGTLRFENCCIFDRPSGRSEPVVLSSEIYGAGLRSGFKCPGSCRYTDNLLMGIEVMDFDLVSTYLQLDYLKRIKSYMGIRRSRSTIEKYLKTIHS